MVVIEAYAMMVAFPHANKKGRIFSFHHQRRNQYIQNIAEDWCLSRSPTVSVSVIQLQEVTIICYISLQQLTIKIESIAGATVITPLLLGVVHPC